MPLNEPQCRSLLDTARATIRAALQDGCDVAGDAGSPDPELLQPAGCFVTLHTLRNHHLRGCIGRLQSGQPLVRTVQECARDVLNDPRFLNNPITLDELPHLQIDISVLSPLREAAGPTDFDLLNDGIYLTFGQRTGCFLPQVARETGWSREQLLERLCTEKMGLGPLIWKNPHARLFTFTVQEIGPEPFEPSAP